MMNESPRVFVVNEPLLRTGSRAIDVRPAGEFGELRFIFPPGQPPFDTSLVEGILERELRDFGRDDYLVPVGHLALIVAASAVAARRAGGTLNLLLWDNRDFVYRPVRLALWSEPYGDGIAA